MSSFLYVLIPVGATAGVYVIRKLRELQWGWVRNTSSLKGKLFIVTGANTGLGFETTKALVSRQAAVLMACRNLHRANEAILTIRKETKEGELIPLELDLSSFDSIRQFAAKIKESYPAFDCLINNAGLAVQTPQLTKENFELHYGVNHLGHFLLVDLLKDNIKNNAARIVVVSSKMHEKGIIDFENFRKHTERPRGERTNTLYNNSKLMNFYFARELYKKGYDAHVLCPGLCHTDFFRDYNPKWYHYILFSPIVWLMLRSARQGLVLDIISDLRRLNTMAVKASNTGMIIIGGGVVKHHICNANLMRNGADFSVFINTASEFDGSDSGARPDEAVSWGKIKKDATPVKVYAEASLVFPILIGETFVKNHFEKKE